MRYIFILLFLILISKSVFADAFCEKRLLPTKYPLKYSGMKREITKLINSGQARDFIDAVRIAGNADTGEMCSHNRFLFVDFVIYFEQGDDYRRFFSGSERDYMLYLLNFRDELYADWMDTLSYNSKTDYPEWSGRDLKGMSLSEFIALGSEKFSGMEKIIKPFNLQGSYGTLKRAVNDILMARTPFSSIMPQIAFSRLEHTNIAEVAGCVLKNIDHYDCNDNVFDMAIRCSGGNVELAMDLFGVLGSQRLYLIRDFKAWMEQNMSPAEFNKKFRAIKDASEIYLKMETYGKTCSSGKLLPRNITDGLSDEQMQAFTLRPYHFWSMASVSYRLAQYGFLKKDAVAAATKPAKRYKSMIRIPGVIYNILLWKNPAGSTVGNYKKVLKEQELGANWGYDLYYD
ncbi:MAG: hypothetical protein KAQ98_09370 [Bacteriovoracaceae bacterium]|nr:hypothetical protein [Bacteriovoracaceae bacterium]